MFGINYRVVNGNPVLNIPSEPLDKEYIKSSVKESFNHFIKLVDSFDPVHLNAIRDIHITMNEAMNKAAEFEGHNAMQEAENQCVVKKIEIYNKIKNILNK